MENLEITTPILSADYSELTPIQKELVDLARKSTERSYAPYSKFRVGAAILLSNGEIVTGANQENAAFPSGTCAERTACYYAHATFPDATFKAIAIAAIGTDGNEVPNPIAPCGACRQALLEYEKLACEGVTVILCSSNKIYILPSVTSLLPLSFSEF